MLKIILQVGNIALTEMDTRPGSSSTANKDVNTSEGIIYIYLVNTFALGILGKKTVFN